jgi:hypothetical protein
MTRNSCFSGLNAIANCRDCGKRTHSSIDGCVDIRLCRDCYDAAGMKNAHFDGHHDTVRENDCKYCQKSE